MSQPWHLCEPPLLIALLSSTLCGKAQCRLWSQARRADVCPVHLLCLWGSHSRSQPRRLPGSHRTPACGTPLAGPPAKHDALRAPPTASHHSPPPMQLIRRPKDLHFSCFLALRHVAPSLPLHEMVPPAPPRAAPTLIYFLPTPKLMPTPPSKLTLVSPPCVLRQCPVAPERTARPNTSQSPPFISGHRRLLGRGQVSGFQSLVCPVAAACRCPKLKDQMVPNTHVGKDGAFTHNL